MREIIFRGKQNDGEWVYGYYLPYHAVKDTNGKDVFAQIFVEPDEKHPKGWTIVTAETVGQYTGLKDKNDAKIFEGDVVKCTSRFDAEDMVVIFEAAEFHLVDCQRYKNYTECCGYRYFGTLETEVIGNIHDNPELLKQGNDDCIYADFNKKAEV